MIDPSLQPRIVNAQEGTAYRLGNVLVTFKAVAVETNGAFSIFEMRTEPGAGMPAHRQRYDDEAVWVLAGSYAFQLGERTVTLEAGDYVFVPRGTVHAYNNRGDTPARLLILLTPGGIHERFFAEVGEFVADRNIPWAVASPPDLARLLSIAQKYGIEILAEQTG